jgi:hypothetical protein
MIRALERRSQRLLGIANDLLGASKLTIWCYEAEHMPAMIDLLIAQGSLRESDRPHCVHWTAVRAEGEPTQEDLGRILDADAMLDEAGIPTLTGQQWKAVMQGPEALQALHQEWFGDPTADNLRALDRVELNAAPLRVRE